MTRRAEYAPPPKPQAQAHYAGRCKCMAQGRTRTRCLRGLVGVPEPNGDRRYPPMPWCDMDSEKVLDGIRSPEPSEADRSWKDRHSLGRVCKTCPARIVNDNESGYCRPCRGKALLRGDVKPRRWKGKK